MKLKVMIHEAEEWGFWAEVPSIFSSQIPLGNDA